MARSFKTNDELTAFDEAAEAFNDASDDMLFVDKLHLIWAAAAEFFDAPTEGEDKTQPEVGYSPDYVRELERRLEDRTADRELQARSKAAELAVAANAGRGDRTNEHYTQSAEALYAFLQPPQSERGAPA